MQFFEKHAPQSYAEMVFDTDANATIIGQYFAGVRTRHLILVGPYGTGKTHASRLLVQGVVQGPWAVSLHGPKMSVRQNAEKQMEELRNACKINPIGSHRIITVDEADCIHRAVQPQFRELMDRAYQNMFVFTTNNLGGIDDAIQHRCTILKFGPTPNLRWLPRAQMILKSEGISLADDDVLDLLSRTDGSHRRVMDALEEIVGRLGPSRSGPVGTGGLQSAIIQTGHAPSVSLLDPTAPVPVASQPTP